MRAALAASFAVVFAVTASAAGRPASRAAESHCNLELVRAGTYYTPVRLAPDLVHAGARLPGTSVIRCERTLVCKRSGTCVYGPGKLVRSAGVRSVAGLDPTAVVLDLPTGRVYTDPQRCWLVTSGGLHCETPVPVAPGQSPPFAVILTAKARVPMAFGSEFCWSTDTGDDTWVQTCPLFIAPWLRPRALPVIAAVPGSTLRLDLGFDPYTVGIAIDRPNGRFVEEMLTPKRTLEWRVPGVHLDGTGYVDLVATRLFHDRLSDFVHYAARIRIVW